ncbi:hypothetical protein [Parachitinimonas caeni]|uniref:Uncharacterized protein n=1 Tax=Parachitinimonas caeni TaxID=3031301 RepID=A0ABT7E1H0_9NEIS|nr:hypothetical protein [Parachitinimonas caeni]MDK2126170.1 hypothetical protein [Parachitinimonas caeni]
MKSKLLPIIFASCLSLSTAQAAISISADAATRHAPNCLFSDETNTFVLPDIRISETRTSELNPGDFGLYISEANQGKLIAGTVKATTASGKDVTEVIFGQPHPKANTSTNGLVWLTVLARSNAATGPVKITLSGFRVQPNADVSSGQIYAILGGGNNANLGSWQGAGIAAHRLAVADIDPRTCFVPYRVNRSGRDTKPGLSITWDVGRNQHKGRDLTVFVGAQLPDGRLFLKNSQDQWLPFDPEQPAHYRQIAQAPSRIDIGILDGSIDTQGLAGTQIFVGYGLGSALFGNKVPFEQMLNQSLYYLVDRLK